MFSTPVPILSNQGSVILSNPDPSPSFPVFVFVSFPVLYALGGVHYHILLSSVILSPIIGYTTVESPPIVTLLFCFVLFYWVCGALGRVAVVVTVFARKYAIVYLSPASFCFYPDDVTRGALML